MADSYLSSLAKQKWDVVVVGGGPGGSIASHDCAKLGLRTLVVDKRQELGSPVRCGEGLAEGWILKAGLEFDPSWCLYESHGAMVHSPSGKQIKVLTKNRGWVLERKRFEKEIAGRAIRAGVKYLLKSRVINVLKDGDAVAGVKVETPEGNFDIPSRIVIAADGVDSKTARYAGINTVVPGGEVDSGYEYEMAGVKIQPTDLIHLYVGNEIAPRGYCWLFMKSEDKANVGIGISGAANTNGVSTAKHYLDKFIAGHPEIFSGAGIIEIKGGCIPVGMPMEKPYAPGLLIIGDAARQVNPIHGGGMGISMEAGRIAARIAKKAIDANDVSDAVLKEYVEEWLKVRGEQLKNVVKVRRFFEKLSDDDLEYLAEVFTPETLLEFSEGNKAASFMKLFVKHPKIALIAAKTLV